MQHLGFFFFFFSCLDYSPKLEFSDFLAVCIHVHTYMYVHVYV